MKRRIFVVLVLIMLFSGSIIASERVSVFVSILPQEYFVSRIGGDLVDVLVMVSPGHSPATYEPTIGQLKDLSGAHLYFRIGVPFETAWMDKIMEANKEMIVVDTRKGIELLQMGAVEGLMDPHIWLDPVLVKTQAMTICHYLIKVDNDNQQIYKENLQRFLYDLEELHQELISIFQDLPNRNLMVFHPAFGYLAHRYTLNQIPIELDGKEPGPIQLSRIIDFGKENQIGVIFVQQQFSQETAKVVAAEIGAVVIPINPLSPDYLENLRQIAITFAEKLGN